MPIFFQQQINDSTRLGIWKIEETEEFFKANVPQHRAVTHPHKRLQHLAGRFLLQYLFPDFPYELIQIAVQHCTGIADFDVRAQVFDDGLIENVVPDLMTPADVGL